MEWDGESSQQLTWFVSLTSKTAAAGKTSSVLLWQRSKSTRTQVTPSLDNADIWRLLFVTQPRSDGERWLILRLYPRICCLRQHADRPAATDSFRICVSAHPCCSLSSKQQHQQQQQQPAVVTDAAEPVIDVESAIGQCGLPRGSHVPWRTLLGARPGLKWTLTLYDSADNQQRPVAATSHVVLPTRSALRSSLSNLPIASEPLRRSNIILY